MFFGKRSKPEATPLPKDDTCGTGIDTAGSAWPDIATGRANTDDGEAQANIQLRQQVVDLEAKVDQAKLQIGQEKAGKRKIFHSLVKIANELKNTKEASFPLLQANEYANQPWYEGGIWRNQVRVLPGVGLPRKRQEQQWYQSQVPRRRVWCGEAVSLSDLFWTWLLLLLSLV